MNNQERKELLGNVIPVVLFYSLVLITIKPKMFFLN